jgi:hypothetical protein
MVMRRGISPEIKATNAAHFFCLTLIDASSSHAVYASDFAQPLIEALTKVIGQPDQAGCCLPRNPHTGSSTESLGIRCAFEIELVSVLIPPGGVSSMWESVGSMRFTYHHTIPSNSDIPVCHVR